MPRSSQADRAELLANRLSRHGVADLQVFLQRVRLARFEAHEGRITEETGRVIEGTAITCKTNRGLARFSFSAATPRSEIISCLPRITVKDPLLQHALHRTNVKNIEDPRIRDADLDETVAALREKITAEREQSELWVATEERTIANTFGETLTEVGTWWQTRFASSIRDQGRTYSGGDTIGGRQLPTPEHIQSFKERAFAIAMAQTGNLVAVDSQPSCVVLSEKALGDLLAFMLSLDLEFPEDGSIAPRVDGTRAGGWATSSFDDLGFATWNNSMNGISGRASRGFMVRQKATDVFKRSYRNPPSVSFLNMSVSPGAARLSELLETAPNDAIYVQSLIDLKKSDRPEITALAVNSYRILGASVANPVRPFQVRISLQKLFSRQTLVSRTIVGVPSDSYFGAYYVPRVLVHL